MLMLHSWGICPNELETINAGSSLGRDLYEDIDYSFSSKDKASLSSAETMPNVATFLGLAMSGAAIASAAALGAYNVDPNSISVSGLSSGGFMSAQLGVAYSDTFKVGFGVFAGGPYDCARGQSVSHFSNIPETDTFE
ncbi:uncharacterized protein Aud_002204 [Aspergillus udagawae]|uniref:Carboxylic ester hydrolase n=1 Tax=Aspergillus udagawae TaxID=91492 RepID=A0A8E0V6E0_9EURO|nr:uncharacterized protein Aud_002204 [Aspergillus udagawae]GIC94874.1 hypothetical protein Aud_002204 [Aspergillus udagawae]